MFITKHLHVVEHISYEHHRLINAGTNFDLNNNADRKEHQYRCCPIKGTRTTKLPTCKTSEQLHVHTSTFTFYRVMTFIHVLNKKFLNRK